MLPTAAVVAVIVSVVIVSVVIVGSSDGRYYRKNVKKYEIYFLFI